MQFHKAPKHVPYLHLHIDINEISRADTFNLLVLQMNDNLKWNTHIDHVSQKNFSHNTISQSNENDIPKEILISIYNNNNNNNLYSHK